MMATFSQYANRLIEWIDSPDIYNAYNDFEKLVKYGDIEPELAFEMVVFIWK